MSIIYGDSNSIIISIKDLYPKGTTNQKEFLEKELEFKLPDSVKNNKNYIEFMEKIQHCSELHKVVIEKQKDGNDTEEIDFTQIKICI